MDLSEELREIDDRCILTVYSTKTKDGKPAFRYDFPEKDKLFELIGFLEAIKLDLLDYANSNPKQAIDTAWDVWG